MNSDSRHQCLIYDGSPSEKLRLIAAILLIKLNEGYRCMYLNSAPMIAGMRSTLAAMGVDVATEVAKARLVLSSVPVTTNHVFNSEEMILTLEDALNQAISDGYKGLWASGDMTWEFGAGNDFEKLLEYEMMLEDLFSKRKELSGVCQYHKDTLPQDAMRKSLLAHRHIVISETLSRINPHYLKNSGAAELNSPQKLDETISQLCR